MKNLNLRSGLPGPLSLMLAFALITCAGPSVLAQGTTQATTQATGNAQSSTSAPASAGK